VDRVCGSWAWCRVWHIPGRCRQPPAASARSRSGCRSHPSLASPNQARSSRSAPAAARGRGAPSSQAAPPALAPHPGLRHRASFVSPCLWPPSLQLLAHHSGSCLACTASSLQSAARASRSQRVHSRQGILPVKSFAVGIQWRREAPRRQTFAGCPSLTRARPPRWGAHRFGFGQNKWVPVVRPLRGTV
jgi:hypothetical protein